MNKTKYNQLREEIIKLCPDILELKFGCVINFKRFNNTEPNKILLKHYERAGIWKYSFIDDIKNNSASVRTFDEGGDLIIIGRPISLEDCLIAIEKKIKTKIKLLEIIGAMTDEKGDTFWKLNKPLQDQSDECISFLHELIYNK